MAIMEKSMEELVVNIRARNVFIILPQEQIMSLIMIQPIRIFH
jgi:hypothetical protein